MDFLYTNSNGFSIEVGNNEYVLNNIEIGAINNALHSVNSYGLDGSQFIGSQLQNRDISIELSILGQNKAHLDRLKRDLFKCFNPKLQGFLRIGDKTLKCRMTSSPYFFRGVEGQQETYQKVQIELVGLDPYFYSDEFLTQISLWLDNFSFPLELGEEGIEMGIMQENTIVNIINNGFVECGFRVNIKANGQDISNPYIYNLDTREFIKINIDLEHGQEIQVINYQGVKRIDLIENRTKTNIFNKLDVDSTFFTLEIGDNQIKVGAETNEEQMETNIFHMEKFFEA